MKCLFNIFLFLILLFAGILSVCAKQNFYLSADFDYKIESIKEAFSSFLPPQKNIKYTKVPRGLIISVAEEEFFAPSDYHIKPSGIYILNKIIAALKTLNNDCVIESHTDEDVTPDSDYTQDWELSIVRANAVADYIVRYGKIHPARVFPLGLGEFMPFKENVSREGFSDKRIDFVIFDYEFKR